MLKWFRICLLGTTFSLTSMAFAATDLLNLVNYKEGSTPTYAEDVLIAMDEKTGQKSIYADQDRIGKLKFPVKLTGDFELSFEVIEDYCCTDNFELFLTAEEHKIKISFYGGGSITLSADSQQSNDASAAFVQDKPNSYRLTVSNNIAKLYVNDVFSQKVNISPSLTYTQLLINGINWGDGLYKLAIGGNGASVGTPNTPSPATDLLNLANHKETSTPPYAEEAIIGINEKIGKKYIYADKDKISKLKFPVKLSGSFDLSFKVLENYCCTDNFELFLTAEEHKIKISFYGGGSVKLSADSQQDSDASTAFVQSRPNAYRLSVKDNVAKLYVNDVFSQKVSLSPGLTYTQLLINGINWGDGLYELFLGGNSVSTDTTTTTTPSTDTIPSSTVPSTISQCTATYEPTTGRVVIPYIAVPNPFGSSSLYQIEMVQQPLTFTFDLDLNSIKPH